EHADHWQLAIGGQSIGFIGPHLPLGGDDALARHDGAKRRDDALAASEYGLIRRGHGDRHETLLDDTDRAWSRPSRYAVFIAARPSEPRFCSKDRARHGSGTHCRLGPLTLQAVNAIRTGDDCICRSARADLRAYEGRCPLDWSRRRAFAWPLISS